jgi:hypothetical protein
MITPAEISAALAQCIEQLATELTGDPPTRRTSRELRYGGNQGLCITMEGAGKIVFCAHNAGGIGGDALDLVKHLRGCSMKEAIEWATAWLGAAPAEPPAPRPRPAPARPASTLPAAIWAEAHALPDSLAAKYLAARGCGGVATDALRFHPACPRGQEGERLPAMLGLMTDPITNAPTGIHRTFLRPDGSGKIEHGTAKMMLGNAGVIRLIPDTDVTIGLGLVEGIETGLALISLAGWRAVWACGSAGGIAKFPVLAGIETLTIFPDRDDAGAGQKAAEECAARWCDAGREAQMIWPPAGADWLDALARAPA